MAASPSANVAENWAACGGQGNLARMLFVATIATVFGLIVFDLLDLLNRPRTGPRAG